jgi:hypothetical protein
VDPAALEFLAARAAAEAHRLLAGALSPGHAQDAPEAGLTVHQDAVRLAAGEVTDAVAGRLAEGSGRRPEALATAVRAWRQGGAAALSVLEEEWAPDGATRARARAALDTAWDGDERPVLRERGNRWTVVGAPRQLRLGRDGRWWPYREEHGRWVPAGEPARDPATALAAAEQAAGDEPTG